MISKISEGITISVETYYQPEYSNPVNSEFMFAYRITIENNNAFPVQLLRRHWYIYDSLKLIPENLINTSVVVTFAQRLER